MHDLFPAIAAFISQHQAWAGPILGFITLLESLVLIGAFVPATALMIMAGGLIAAGVLEPWHVIFWCVLGAVVGDAISYSIGRRLGPRALRRPAFTPHRRVIARTRLFTRTHGAASIFVGRFFGPLRAFVPIMAGMLQMRRRTFQLANVVSAVPWVLTLLAPGYFATRGLAKLEQLGDADWITIGVVCALLIVAAGLYVARTMTLRARRTRLEMASQPIR